jgi:hypothetical protein
MMETVACLEMQIRIFRLHTSRLAGAIGKCCYQPVQLPESDSIEEWRQCLKQHQDLFQEILYRGALIVRDNLNPKRRGLIAEAISAIVTNQIQTIAQVMEETRV